MAWPAYYLWKNAKGKVRTVVCTALSFFFLSEFLKIPDMALGEVYENMFAPIRHGLYVAAIPLLGYVYIKEQSDELKKAFEMLEFRVQERTVELEDALLRLQSEIIKQERTAKELESFAYSVAHDLKAPLRAMEGFSMALAEDYGPSLDAEANSYVGHISTSAMKMGILIDDLLEYSRMGRDELQFADVDLYSVAMQAVSNISQDILDSGASVTVEENLPGIHGHKLVLEMIFQNLTSNAVKFCPLGSVPEIHISGNQNAEGVEIVIKDNGIGISDADKDKIFEIFKRLHGAETYQGTGIGLAMVKKGVNLHSGSIRIESTPGKGTAFHLFSHRNRKFNRTMAALNMRGCLLLIVEDEPTDALLLHKALRSHLVDAQIELASSGADALEFMMSGASKIDSNNERLPQLVLMDLNLPGINGFELLKQFKSTDRIKEIPIVVLTSSSDTKDVQKAFSAGANSYRVKPNTYSDSVALTGNIVNYWLSLDQRSAGKFTRVENPGNAV